MVLQECVSDLLPGTMDFKWSVNGDVRGSDERFQCLMSFRTQHCVGNQLRYGEALSSGAFFQDGRNLVGNHNDCHTASVPESGPRSPRWLWCPSGEVQCRRQRRVDGPLLGGGELGDRFSEAADVDGPHLLDEQSRRGA